MWMYEVCQNHKNVECIFVCLWLFSIYLLLYSPFINCNFVSVKNLLCLYVKYFFPNFGPKKGCNGATCDIFFVWYVRRRTGDFPGTAFRTRLPTFNFFKWPLIWIICVNLNGKLFKKFRISKKNKFFSYFHPFHY